MDLLDGIPVHWNTFPGHSPGGEAEASTARVVVIPVPYDSTTSYKGGARHGPQAIISASRHLEDYDLELDRDLSLVGIHTTAEIAADASGPKAVVGQMRRAVLSGASHGKLVALLGGEHTITIGAVQALAEIHPDISVLYLDAHADMRAQYMGTSWGHASVGRRVHEICPLVLVGVRSLSAEEKRFIDDVRIPVVFWGPAPPGRSQLAKDVLKSLSPHVYVSIDLDVFDPSMMAAVGTPEPEGMTWPDVISLLRAVGEEREIVGFDITELSPGEGPEACAYAAAKLAYKLIGYSTWPS